MAHTYAQLRALSMEDLIRDYDATAPTTQVGLSFIRDEIMRREMEAQSARMLTMTHEMRLMTALMTVLTVVNVILVWWALWRS